MYSSPHDNIMLHPEEVLLLQQSYYKNMGFVIQQTWVQVSVLLAHPMTLGKLHDFAELQTCRP